jgi:hypothetical protein
MGNHNSVGQFDFSSAAALARLKSDSLAVSPVDKVAAGVAGIGLKILDLAGFHGVAPLADLIMGLKNLAANKDEANLIYFGKALVDDIRRLYELSDEMRRRVEEVVNSEKFNQAVANATLHITRTNVEARIKRVASLIVNGIGFRDLEPENLDDMMRAAVELSETDISLLKELIDHPSSMNMNETDIGRTDSAERMGSVAKLQAVAFVQLRTPGLDMGANIVVLLPRGKKFYERLQEIAIEK